MGGNLDCLAVCKLTVYSPKIIAERIKKVEKNLGLTLEYHDVREISAQNKRLTELIGDDGRLVRPLSTEEEEWVLNERSLAKLDFRYFCTRYAFILDFGGNLKRFQPNIAQEIALQVWGELEEKGHSISIQQLKARQLGVSTLTEIAVAHRAQFYTYVNAVVGSSDPAKSTKMAQMMDRCWENEPWWMLPRTTGYRVGELIEFGDLNSGISIQHGNQFSGIARGDTPTVCHLSELCDFNNPEELVDASLLRAMHTSPWMFLILESTAKGRRNWWHKTWEFSKENWQAGRARFYPMFLPWFIGSDIYPTETWLLEHPIPQEFEPSQLTCHHADRARAAVLADPLLTKHLGKEWVMPIEQMWWWEVTRAEYAAKKELSQFYSETPADDLEAFQSTNVSAFDSDTLSLYRERSQHPLAVYGFVGRPDEIPLRMQPDRRDVDVQQPALTIRARWNPSVEPFECQLVPLKFTGYNNFDPMGKFLLWEMPEEDETYGLGVDTSDGIGLDRSTIQVLRKGTPDRNDALVAEFASAYINAFDLWPLCLAVGTLYSPESSDRRIRQARIVIECKGNGESTQLELRKRGWGNFHPWIRYDSKRLRPQDAHKLGWFTNSWSRAMMMDMLLKAVRDEWIDVYSPYFVDEMADLERDEFRQSLAAAYGGNDDRIMAGGFVFFSLHALELKSGQPLIAAQRKARQASQAFDPVYVPGYQGADTGMRQFDSIADLMRQYEESLVDESW